MTKSKEQNTPLHRAMKKAMAERDLPAFAKLFKKCETLSDRYSGAMVLAMYLHAQHKKHAYRGILRQIRLMAVDDYLRLQVVRLLEDGGEPLPDIYTNYSTVSRGTVLDATDQLSRSRP